MKKRILCVILALCVILSALPLSVFAEDTHYGVWILGDEITSSRKISQKDGWEFDPNTYTLTLRNFKIGTIGTKISALFDKYSLFGLIYVDTSVHDLTIRLEGQKNYLGDEAFPYENCTKYKEAYYGICATNTNLTITGNRGAILKIQTHENAIECKKLIIKDSVTVEAVSQGTCIYACGDITIEGAGTLVNARTTDIIQGQAAMSTRGKLYVGESSYLVTCSVAKSSSWERVGFLHNHPDTNYISSLYVAGAATVDGGIITAYFYKRKGSYINEYDYSIEDYGETKAFYCKRLEMDNGGEVNVFFERAEGKDPQNEYGFDTRNDADSWEDLWRGCIYFQGDGVMRVGMTNGNREEKAITMKNRSVIAGPHVKVSKTYIPTQQYSKYSDFVMLTGKKHNSITLFMQQGGGRLNPWWSYYTDKSDASYIYETLELKDIVKSDLDLKLTAEPGTYTVDPMVNAGCAIPEMAVQSGATLKLTMQRGENYTFTKPICLDGGNLEIDGTTANITGLDIRGTGTVTFNSGTVSGTVEKSVQVVINDGNIDIPDYGNAVDGDGNAVHKFVYTVETEERYTQPIQIKTMTGPDEYDTVSLKSGLFHRGENNERLLCLWLDRSDRVLRLRVNDPNENEHKDCLALRFGTNVFTEGPHLNIRSSGVVVAQEGERLILSAIENQTPTDMQNQYVKEVLWFLSTDGGQNFKQIGYSYGNMGGVNYNYTIPSVTKDQNGYIYRAKVTYRNGEDVWGGTMETYTYDATIYMDQPVLRAPERYVVGQTAKFEVVHPALPEGITMKYFWQTSKDGESWNEIPSIFGKSSTYEPEITADMAGMKVRAVVQTWKNYKRVGTTILEPVTINISESIPVIITHPKDGVDEAPEQPKPAKPGEITIVFGRYHFFNVTASGSDIKYQWQISNDNGRTFVDIPYANDNMYSLSVGKENNGKLVRCVISNEYGTAVSNAARLTVYYQPKFADTISDTTVNVGKKAEFKLTLEQGNPYGIEVTWQVSKDGGNTFTDVTQADGTFTLDSEIINGEEVWSTTFTTRKLNKNHNGYKYRCIARNAQNETYVGTWRSDATTLTVTGTCENDSHDFDNGTVITEPACTEPGLKRYQCNNCTYYKDDPIAAPGHDYAPATCTEPETCKICRATYGKPLGHSFSGHEKNSEKHWQKCSVCNFTTEKEPHTYIWESGNGQYWKRCAVCRFVTAVTDMPRIFINGADIICPLKDYEFSFALPDGCTEITAGYRFEDSDAEVTVTEENGEFSAKVNASNLKIGTMTVHVSAKLKDGFIISAKKEVTVQDHSGGEATCTEKAICDICGNEYGEFDSCVHTGEIVWDFDSLEHWKKYDCCGMTASNKSAHQWREDECTECGYKCKHSGGKATCTKKADCDICGCEYGETDPNNHGKLTHIEEVKATTDKEGNIEYWHCEECGTSFKDSDGKERVDNTVIPRISKSESSGDESLTSLILALLLSGGLLITVLLRKKEN